MASNKLTKFSPQLVIKDWKLIYKEMFCSGVYIV